MIKALWERSLADPRSFPQKHPYLIMGFSCHRQHFIKTWSEVFQLFCKQSKTVCRITSSAEVILYVHEGAYMQIVLFGLIEH